MVRGMVRRIRATADTLRQVADGDLTTRAAVAGRDEIGQMAGR
ncbi:MAG: HAMP domain-containing protein [Kineosporiaceae bacterium]